MAEPGRVWDPYRTQSAGFCPISVPHAGVKATPGHKLYYLSLKCAILNLLSSSFNYCAKSGFIAKTHRELKGFEILSKYHWDVPFCN